ncbi:hypothetical protein [Sclerotium rolfsii fusarivirus 1]|uniref:Uncharacterized protein n=1 Tax=Sclerotium rolfsii fusarivirus 1 TaxID=2490823 RepID=A0AAD1A2I9_9VIRU|nr:hypothetical protein QKQ12_gp2 [Sclerotium rolfsii fusarivirus 1]AZF86097.1 hypothetical protein [Sclerotium rolfsii fusarivirus 1]
MSLGTKLFGVSPCGCFDSIMSTAASMLADVKALTKLGRETNVFQDLPKAQEDIEWSNACKVAAYTIDTFLAAEEFPPLTKYAISEYKGKVAEAMRDFFEMWISNEKPHSPELLPKRAKAYIDWKAIAAQHVPAKPHVEEAPSVGSASPSDPEDEPWIDVEVKKKAKAKKAKGNTFANKVKAAFVIGHPVADDVASVADTVHSVVNVNQGVELWTRNGRPSSLIWVPPVKALFFDGERVKNTEFKKVLASGKGVWETVETEGWYNGSRLTVEQLQVLAGRGLIPEDRLIGLASQSKANTGDASTQAQAEVADVTKEPLQAQAAKVAYYAAQSEKLIKARIPAKINFIKVWFKRLLTVPESLDPVPVAEKFHWLLKKECKKEGQILPSINKLFYSFLNGNLASWKAGETKKAFLERTDKARKFWWGNQATLYLDEFNLLPSSAALVRPKTGLLISAKATSSKVAEEAPKSLKKGLEAAVAKGKAAIAAVKEKALEKNLDTVEGAKFHAKILREHLKNKSRGLVTKMRGFFIGGDKTPSTISKVSSAMWGWFKRPFQIVEQTPGGPKTSYSVFAPFKNVYRFAKQSTSYLKSKFVNAIKWLGWHFNDIDEPEWVQPTPTSETTVTT